MSRFSPSESDKPKPERYIGLPNDVDSLKALVINLHGRAQELELCIMRQLREVRILERDVVALRDTPLPQHADLSNVSGQDQAGSISPGNEGKNGSS